MTVDIAGVEPGGMPVDRVDETRTTQERARFWRSELGLADKAEAAWRTKAKQIVKQYRAEAGEMAGILDPNENSLRRYQILWSNTEILKAAVFSRMPEPDVSRRFEGQGDPQDQMARFGSELLERAIAAHIDPNDPKRSAVLAFEAARDDALLPGRGTVRVRYAADIGQVPLQVQQTPTGELDPITGEPVTAASYVGPDGQPTAPDGGLETGAPYIEQKVAERVWIEPVYWEDVRFSPARAWADVWWVAYRHVFTREELEREFGARQAEDVPTSTYGKETPKMDEPSRLAPVPESTVKRAIVWEIWSKRHNQVIWLAEGDRDVLRAEPPPLSFEGFFDCPQPLMLCGTTDTMVPVPLYSQYEDLAHELNIVTTRISKLARAIKAVGLYDAQVRDIVELADATDGQLRPIDVMGQLRDKGGLAGAISWWPIDVQAKALIQLLQHREELKREIWEITGLSDLIRGQTNAGETLGAQQLKAQFGTFRMSPLQLPMARMVRDGMRMIGEVVAEMFDPPTLAEATGLDLQQVAAVMPMLRDERMRGYRLDIETDQLVRPDQAQQKQEVVEFTGAVTQYLTGTIPLAQAAPPLVPLIMELLKFMARSFKVGRTIESLIDQTAAQLEQMVQQQQLLQQQQAAMEAQAAAQQPGQQAEAQQQQQGHEAEMQRQQQDHQAGQAQEDRVVKLMQAAMRGPGGAA